MESKETGYTVCQSKGCNNSFDKWINMKAIV